jgi:hypothetical protein
MSRDFKRIAIGNLRGEALGRQWRPIDLCGMMSIYRQLDRPALMAHRDRLFKMAIQQGPSERKGEAYCGMYVEPRSEARTQPEAFFNIRRKGGDRFRRRY